VSVSPDIGWVALPQLNPEIATLTIGHGDFDTFYAPVRHYSRFLTQAIGVSEEICRKYRDECGMPAERVTWIPYGVEVLDQKPAGTAEGLLRLLYVGRLDEPQKRISDVVKIVKQLRESNVGFAFDIVGDGDERPLVERELGADIADGHVRMHGWVGSENVIEAMRGGEVFILASSTEGFCISLTEAMANGCAPVVTDIESGNKQLVEDGVNGFVVPVGDVDAFVDRIKLLAADRSRLNEMRRAAWYTGKQYSVDRMVENYVSCFERAIEHARSNPRTPDPDFPLMESCRSKYPLWLRRLKAKAMRFAGV
jgi:glycosyltransferase involved in cell wall biosynthesis